MTFFKPVIALLSVFLFTVACQKGNGNSQSDHQPGEVEEGGISSGGGGTLPANPISTLAVYRILESSKKTLRLYMNYQRLYPEYAGRFYAGPRNLATVLEEIDLDVLKDKPCKDKRGRDVDASIYGSAPNRICLSAFRIAPKLIEETAHKEINALILHELSHLLGATETEAVDLQRKAVFGLANVDYENLWRNSWDARMQMEDVENKVFSLTDRKTPTSPVQLAKDLDAIDTALDLFLKLTEFDRTFPNPSLSYFDFAQKDLLQIQRARLHWVKVFANTLIPGPFQADYIAQYDKAFNGAAEVTYDQLNQNSIGRPIENVFGSEKIKRNSSIQDAMQTLSELKLYFMEQTALAIAIAHDGPLPALTMPGNPESPNPFLNFLGTYSVESVTCRTDWEKDPEFGKDLIKIEISQNSQNAAAIDFKSFHSSGWGTEIWARSHFGQFDQLSGDAVSATRVHEEGMRWINNNGHGYRKKINRIGIQNGALTYFTRMEDSKMDMNGIKTNYYECTYQLKK